LGVVFRVDINVDVVKTGSSSTSETSILFWNFLADWSGGRSMSWSVSASVLGVVDGIDVHVDVLQTESLAAFALGVVFRLDVNVDVIQSWSGAAEASVLFWGFLAHWGWSMSWSVTASVVRVVLGVNLDVDVLEARSGAAETGGGGLNFFARVNVFTWVFSAFWVFWLLWLFRLLRVDRADWYWNWGWSMSSGLSFSWSVLGVVNGTHTNVDSIERSGAAHTASWLFRSSAAAWGTAALRVVDGVDFDVDIIKAVSRAAKAGVLFWHFLAYWSGSVAVSASVLGVVLGVNLDVDVFEGDMRRLTAFTLGVVFRVDVDVDVLKAISSIVRSCKGTGAEERNEQKNESSHCRGVSVESA
jgi:hypothetical protein